MSHNRDLWGSGGLDVRAEEHHLVLQRVGGLPGLPGDRDEGKFTVGHGRTVERQDGSRHHTLSARRDDPSPCAPGQRHGAGRRDGAGRVGGELGQPVDVAGVGAVVHPVESRPQLPPAGGPHEGGPQSAGRRGGDLPRAEPPCAGDDLGRRTGRRDEHLGSQPDATRGAHVGCARSEIHVAEQTHPLRRPVGRPHVPPVANLGRLQRRAIPGGRL